MASKLNTPPVASMPAQQSNYMPQIKLSLGDYNVNDGSIGCNRDGTRFAFTLWPLPDALVSALEGVAQKHGRICLYCCGQPLLFDLVSLELVEPLKARLVGQIVSGISYAKGNPRQANAGDWTGDSVARSLPIAAKSLPRVSVSSRSAAASLRSSSGWAPATRRRFVEREYAALIGGVGGALYHNFSSRSRSSETGGIAFGL